MAEPKTTDTIVAGLLRERDGYLRVGRKDRARLVEEQLALRGYTVADTDADADAVTDTDADDAAPARTPPRGRGGRPRQTTSTSASTDAGTGTGGKE